MNKVLQSEMLKRVKKGFMVNCKFYYSIVYFVFIAFLLVVPLFRKFFDLLVEACFFLH